MKKPKFCVYCGFKLRDGDIFCPNCGVRIEADKWYGVSTNLASYKMSLDDLKRKYESKESEALDLVNKRFAPPQITYNKFIGEIDNCRVIFFKEAESAYDIVDLIDSPSEKVISELEEKIKVLETIIEKLNDLINELIISSKDSIKSDDEIQNLFKDMDDLIDSVKKYE